MCDRWHRLQSGGSPAIHGLRVGQPPLRKTDNPLRTADRLFTAVTVQSGPTGAEAGFDGVAVGRDGSDGECGTDPAITSAALMVRCSRSTSINSLVPAASLLTFRDCCLNASSAVVKVPTSRALASAFDPGNAPGL